jgi:hypothetical protein
MKLTDAEVLTFVDQEMESSIGYSGGETSKERALAWDYYLSKPMGNEVEGRSSVVTSDVSDVVDGMIPSLLRLFTTSDNLVNFEPTGPEDVKLAAQESDYVNYTFFKKNPNAFILLYTWFFDALIQKNGVVKAWRDEKEVVTEESYSNLSEEEVFALLEDEELDPVEREEKIEVISTPEGDVPVTLHDIKFKRTTTKGTIRVENVPPEEYRISPDSRSIDPTEARMIGQEREITRSELISMGFSKDIVDNLPTSANSNDTEEKIARRDIEEYQTGVPQRAQELIQVREAYIKLDMTGNGKSELRQVITAGNQVLLNEPADRQPYHVISPQPLPHKHFGRASAEKVMDIQQVNTTLLRQILDNYYHTNNPGHGVWEQGIGDNTLDDLLTTDIGRVVRFDRPVGESYAPMTVPFVAGQAFTALEYFDKVKRDRTGVQADGDGLNPEQLKNIQQSVLTQANDLSRMKIEAVARIFAETGIKSLFLHIHELILKHQDRQEVINLRGEWIPIDPTSWKNRYDMTVNIGLGIGSKESKMMQLNQIWEKQTQGLQMGITKPNNLYNTATEMANAAGFKDGNTFFTNPGDGDLPQNDEQMKMQQQQMEMVQRQQQLDAQGLQLKDQKQQQDMQFKMAQLQQKQQEAAANLDEKSQKRQDDLMIEIQKLKNDIAEMELKYEEAPPMAEFNYDPMTGQMDRLS